MILGIGVDIVDHERVRGLFERIGRARFLARVLTTAEREYCLRMVDPVPHVAARIAAKEATFKALAGTYEARGIGWREMEVVHDEHRRPHLRLHGRAESRASELALTGLHLSMTHGDNAAVAMVVAERG